MIRLKKDVIFFALLLGLGFLVFAPYLNNNFVWDDKSQILNNEMIQNGPVLNFFTVSTFDSNEMVKQGSYYKPFMTLWNYTFFHLGQGKPFLFHLMQLLVYLINAFLIYKIYEAWGLNKGGIGPLLAILFFAFHPINLENIFYIANIQDVLFLFLGLLSLLFMLKSKKLDLKRMILVYCLLLGSLLSKETGFAFIIMLPVISFFRHREKFKNIISISLLALSTYLMMRFCLAKLPLISKVGYGQMIQVDLRERLLTFPSILEHYVFTLFYAKKISMGYHWIIETWSWEVAIANLLVVLGGGGILYWRRKVIDWILILWVCIGLIIHSQLIPLDFTVANRWFYFSFVGIILLLMQSELIRKKITQVLLAFLLLFNILQARQEGEIWKNELTFYQRYLERNPTSFDLNHNLGFLYLTQGKEREGCELIRKSYQLNTHWWVSQNNYGVCLQKVGQFKLAEKLYREAINVAKYRNAFLNLMTIYKREKRQQELESLIKEYKLYYAN